MPVIIDEIEARVDPEEAASEEAGRPALSGNESQLLDLLELVEERKERLKID